MWYLVLCFSRSLCADSADVPAPVLVVALRSVAEVAAFSPNTQFLSVVWGFLLLLKEF